MRALRTELEQTDVGIVCLTQENLAAQWLHFESGALAKREHSKLCTFLLGVHLDEVNPRGPLHSFQHTEFKRPSVERLARHLNQYGGSRVEKKTLDRRFKKYWPELEKALIGIRDGDDSDDGDGPQPPRSPEPPLDPKWQVELMTKVSEIREALIGEGPTRVPKHVVEAFIEVLAEKPAKDLSPDEKADILHKLSQTFPSFRRNLEEILKRQGGQ